MTHADLIKQEFERIWAVDKPVSRKGTYGTSYNPNEDKETVELTPEEVQKKKAEKIRNNHWSRF